MGRHGQIYIVSVVMVFEARGEAPNLIPLILLNGTRLERVYHFKYHSQLTHGRKDNSDIEKELRALLVRENMLASGPQVCAFLFV